MCKTCNFTAFVLCISFVMMNSIVLNIQSQKSLMIEWVKNQERVEMGSIGSSQAQHGQ